MKKQRLKVLALSSVLTAGAVVAGSAYADPKLDAIVAVGQSKIDQAKKSQSRINKLQDETTDIVNKFKQVNKTIEGLRIYNAQLEQQLESQREIMGKLEESISQITVIQRQVQPLVLEMLDGIEQFVELDAPYRKEQRLERIEKLREIMTDADITIAEKFRQVLEIYSIESEYARKIDTYETTLSVNGQDLNVNVLAIGRVALIYQTVDGSQTGAWDRQSGEWVELDAGEYKTPVHNAIRIAQKKSSKRHNGSACCCSGGFQMRFSVKKHLLSLAAVGVMAVSSSALAQQEKATSLDQLLQMMRNSKVVESKEHKQREAEFMREKSKRASLLSKAEATKAAEEARSAKLEEQYEEQDLQIKALREQREEKMGSLNELFGHLKTASGDLQASLKNSLISLQYPGRADFAADYPRRWIMKPVCLRLKRSSV